MNAERAAGMDRLRQRGGKAVPQQDARSVRWVLYAGLGLFLCLSTVWGSGAASAHITTPARGAASTSAARICAKDEIRVGGGDPDAIAVNPQTNRIYTLDYNDNGLLTVISGSTDTVVATVPVGTQPQNVAVDPATDTIYVTGPGSKPSMLWVINGATDTVTAALTIPGTDDNGWGLAVDPQTNMVYVTTSRNTVEAISGRTRKVTAAIAVNSPAALAVDPRTNRIYAEDFNGMAVISGSTHKVVATLNGVYAEAPQGLAVDPATNIIYAAWGGGVTVINGRTNTVTTSITTGTGQGYGVAVDPTTDTVYSTNDNYNNYQGTITAVNGRTNTVINEIKGATITAFDVAADPRTGLAYVAMDPETVMAVGSCS